MTYLSAVAPPAAAGPCGILVSKEARFCFSPFVSLSHQSPSPPPPSSYIIFIRNILKWIQYPFHLVLTYLFTYNNHLFLLFFFYFMQFYIPVFVFHLRFTFFRFFLFFLTHLFTYLLCLLLLIFSDAFSRKYVFLFALFFILNF